MITPALREALNSAISSGRFIDTKIVVFSRRDSSGKVCKPRALYANSRVLRSVPYFRDLLFGAFAEAETRDFSEIDGDEFAEDYGYSSDSDLEEDGDFESPDAAGIQPASSLRQQEAPDGEYEENPQAGKVIRVQDVAFITFQAFLLYLYTNSIDFAPFGSEENRKSRSSEISCTSGGDIPKPSPKSIYRLADKYDLPKLKALALNHIRSNIQGCDIVRETFSVFASRYDEIRTVQVFHLVSVWLSGEEESKVLHERLDQKINSYAAGELEHAVEAMTSIWDLSRKRGALPSIPQVHQDHRVSYVPTQPEERMRTSLIKSIQGGSLLHRKYWARQSRGGSIRPVYFPSAVPGSTFSGAAVLMECCKGGGGHLEKSEEYEFPEDSDCESGSELASNQLPGNAEVCCEKRQEQKLLPVLKIGSLVTWRSLLFYLCTGEIQFAPLKSLGPDRRSQRKPENPRSGLPVPCSPKTIYTLAKKFQIPPLIDRAFRDIEAKVTEENVTTETFSRFASQHPEIIAMGWRHLNARLGTEKTTEFIREVIQGMAEGNAAHRADALKFGLYGALQQEGPRVPTILGNNTPCKRHRKRGFVINCSSCTSPS